MRWWRELRRRMRAVFRGSSLDRDLADEMRLHIELETEDLVRTQGLSRAEARRRALVAFGGEEQTRAAHRDMRGVGWVEHVIQDLRYALRGVGRAPGFAIAVVLTLALGIGANTAMFSVVDRTLFRPPPMLKDASHTHRVYTTQLHRGQQVTTGGVQYARYVDLTRDTRSFTRTAEITNRQMAVGVGTDTRQMTVGIVTAGFFGFFDAPPALGRYFTAAEDTPPTGTEVAVLSYGFWQGRYGGRADVLGRTVHIGAQTYTVIGVASRGFVGVWQNTPPAAYIPLSAYANGQFGHNADATMAMPALDWPTTYSLTFARMLVQRKPDVSLEAADADLTRAYQRSYAAELAVRHHPASPEDSKRTALAGPVLEDRGPQASSTARVATWVSGVALIVWLIACANVANLLLARALRRRREVAVRLALGVSRARLAAQLLTESLLLALLGGVAGLMVAQWGGALLRARLQAGAGDEVVQPLIVFQDPRTLLFAGGAALVAGLLAGLAPLFQARRTDLTADLATGAREGRRKRSKTRLGLLLFQGTLSVVLLVGAGLFVRSLVNVRGIRLGYDPDVVSMVNLNMRGVKLDSARSVVLRQSLLNAARGIPGVESAARRNTIPFWWTWSADLYVAGIDSVSKLGEFDVNAVSPDYFATMGTRIMRGRGIGDQDVAGAPGAMVVSQAMARTLWPGEDAIGQCVHFQASDAPCTYVVGIAENIRAQRLSKDPGLFYYVSAAQVSPQLGGLAVRTRGDATRYRETLRRTLQAVMPGASYVTVTPMSDIVGQQTQSWSLGTLMFVIFGLLALVLAAVGLYGVIAYDVDQRTHELGVRVAFGARMGDLTRLVLGQGLRIAAASVVLGLAIAFAAGPWIQPLLFEESPRDPAVLAVVALVLLGVAGLASVIPARRAGRVDPMVALRTE